MVVLLPLVPPTEIVFLEATMEERREERVTILSPSSLHLRISGMVSLTIVVVITRSIDGVMPEPS